MELRITIKDEDEIAILEEIALDNELSMVDYATNIVRGFLKSQLRGRYLKHLQDKKPEDLKIILGMSYREFNTKIKNMKAKKEIKS